MQYMGGKFRQSSVIADYIKSNSDNIDTYVEPFCGMASVANKLTDHFDNIILADNNKFIILLLKSLVDDTFVKYEPKNQEQIERDYMTFSIYKELDTQDMKNINLSMVAYWGYGMSFGGKWFGGLARSTRDDAINPSMPFVKRANNSLLKIQKSLKMVKNLKIIHSSYDLLKIPDNSIVYLDPPYVNRVKAHRTKTGFNYDKFWNWVRFKSVETEIITTEFIVPNDFEVIHSWGDTVVRHLNGNGRDNTNEVLVKYIRKGNNDV